jgi:hypothetical protein
MFNVRAVNILHKNIRPLKETSKYRYEDSDYYMTDSMIDVVNFDLVKNEYVKDMSLSELPESNDAFYVDDTEEMCFIEFKGGRLNKEKIYGIRLKIFDSLLILKDIININISHTRTNLNYILVYNENKNPLSSDEDNVIQVSKSRVAIGDYLMKKGRLKLIRFNLERFEKLYFKNVFTITEEEFNSRFVKRWEA